MNPVPRRFVDHVTLWIRWRWFLVGVVFAAALLMAIISSLVPKTYRATAVVLPPFEGGTPLSFLGGVSVDVFGANEVPASSMATLLKSRALKDRIQKRIDLMEHYQKPDLERAYSAFESHLQVEFESQESFAAVNIIAFKIYILDRDPQFCAKLVNVVVEEWDALCVDLNRRGATLRRQFVEDNLRKTAAELAVCEDSLRSFQEQHGIAALDAQVQGTISAAVVLEQKIAEARIAIEVLEKLYRPEHPLLQRARLEMQGLLQEQKKLQSNSSPDGLLLPIGTAPEITLSYYRLLRQVRILQGVNEVLAQQYEQAKIQELRDSPALRILDRGEVPLYKYKPRRFLLVLTAAISAFFLAALAMYFADYVQRARGTAEYHWIEDSSAQIRNDLRRLRSLILRRRK